eukprot:scaffold44_cov411-Prasinococcus_capsulatus_cf.AAC.2
MAGQDRDNEDGLGVEEGKQAGERKSGAGEDDDATENGLAGKDGEEADEAQDDDADVMEDELEEEEEDDDDFEEDEEDSDVVDEDEDEVVDTSRETKKSRKASSRKRKAKPSTGRKRKTLDAVEDQAEEASDEEEDLEAEEYEDNLEDEDDEGPKQKKKKSKKKAKETTRKKKTQGSKAKKRPRMDFLDIEARVDDESEEEDEDGDEDALIDDKGLAVEDADEFHQRIEARNNDLLRQAQEGRTEEELEKFIQERYASQQYTAPDENAETTELEQQALQPSVTDPKLWLIKARPGKEREAVICLLQKYCDHSRAGKELKINAAIARDDLKGYIYVESDREAYVSEAVNGLRSVFAYKFKIVPLKEMTTVLTVTRKNENLIRPNSWVRAARGVYKGDLCQVLEVDYGRNFALVKLIPRLDTQAIVAKVFQEELPEKKGRQRPAARLFSRAEFPADIGERIVMEREDEHGKYEEIAEANLIFRDGFLHKQMSLVTIKPEPAPSFEELQRFTEGLDGANRQQSLEMLSAAREGSRKSIFGMGDVVVVKQGDLENLTGTVEKVTDDMVTILPQHDELHEPLDFPAAHLQKFFTIGDHVKVTSGSHEGVSGMVTRIEGNVAVVFTDLDNEEIRALVEDLVLAMGVSTGMESIGQFELQDMVQLDSSTFGVITKVEKDACQVLINASTPARPVVRVVKLPEIQRKMNSKNSTAQDQFANTIQAGDMVAVIDGDGKGKRGTVKHIHKGIVFVHSRDVHVHNGMMAMKARHCKVLGGKNSDAGRVGGGFGGGSRYGSDMLRSPAHSLRSPAPHQMMSPAANRPYGKPSGPSFGGVHGFQRDNSLIGKMLKIKKGPWKGYQGRVIDATETTCRLELEANANKVVTVSRAYLPIDQPQALAPNPASLRDQFGRTPAHRFQTPAHEGFGGQTPMHPGFGALGGTTPMRDGLTPSNLPPTRDGPTPQWEGGYTAPTPGMRERLETATPDVAPSPALGATPGIAPTPHYAPSPNLAGLVNAPSPNFAPTPANTYTPGPFTANPYTPGMVGTPHILDPARAGTPSLAYTPSDAATPLTPSYGVATPGTAMDPGTVNAYASPHIPEGPIPSTPGDMEFNAGTPMGPVDDGGASDPGQVRLFPGVLVTLQDKTLAVVQSVGEGGMLSVRCGSLEELERSATGGMPLDVNANDVTIERPKKRDQLIIVRGEHVGMRGSLIGQADLDGIVKPEGNQDIKIIEIKCLAKVCRA